MWEEYSSKDLLSTMEVTRWLPPLTSTRRRAPPTRWQRPSATPNEAIAKNFAAAQRRSIGIAEGGLQFMRLQEDNARAVQEFFANGVRLLQLQQRNSEVRAGLDG